MTLKAEDSGALPQLGAWGRQAACRGKHELFFSSDQREVAQAKRICAACPVKNDCLEYALDHLHGYFDQGVWGGTGSRRRRMIRRARRLDRDEDTITDGEEQAS